EASISDEPFDRRHGRSYPGPVWVNVRSDAPRVVGRPHERGGAALGELRPAPDPGVCRLTPDLSIRERAAKQKEGAGGDSSAPGNTEGGPLAGRLRKRPP